MQLQSADSSSGPGWSRAASQMHKLSARLTVLHKTSAGSSLARVATEFEGSTSRILQLLEALIWNLPSTTSASFCESDQASGKARFKEQEN